MFGWLRITVSTVVVVLHRTLQTALYVPVAAASTHRIAAHQQHPAGGEHADNLGAGTGWIGQRAAEIENGTKAERCGEAGRRPSWPGGRAARRET